MEKRPTLRFLAGREDAGSTPDPADDCKNVFFHLYYARQPINFECNFEDKKTYLNFTRHIQFGLGEIAGIY